MAFVTGSLTVVVFEADDLYNVLWAGGWVASSAHLTTGTLNPYVVLTVGGTSVRSITHLDGGSTPAWNWTATFPQVASTQSIRVEVYHEHRVMRDTLIASGVHSLAQVAADGRERVDIQVLRSNGRPGGMVRVQLEFKQLQGQQLPQSSDVVQAAEAAQEQKDALRRVQSSRRAKVPNWILPIHANTDVWSEYKQGKVLGKGTYGVTYLAHSKASGEPFAVKVISKRRIATVDEVQDIQREVDVMHHLKGHPNIVTLRDVFEDTQQVAIVMDLCAGGQLLDRIVRAGTFTEAQAASVVRTIVSVTVHCHNMGVIHRDLKPENFLISDNGRHPILKAADFGLSTFFKEGEVFNNIVGSPFYIAPEVLQGGYGKEADIWSCGVILYILLCGYPPFRGNSAKAIFNEVATKPVDMTGPAWEKVSAPAKDCVLRMLTRHPKLRATGSEILRHDWLRENGVARDAPIEPEVLTRLRKFTTMNWLKREALKVIAVNLPTDEVAGMRHLFEEMDKDHSGTVSVAEFGRALRRKGAALPEADVARLLAAADTDADGTLDWQEFLAATLTVSRLEREERLRAAFAHFDTDGNGWISRDEMRVALQKTGFGEEQMARIIEEADRDNDGGIDWMEFVLMMRQL